MSIRENIQFFHTINTDDYLDMLKREYDVQEHPNQPRAYLVDGLPFYHPMQTEEHIFILGFNMVPLSPKLIQVLAEHPELASEDTFVRWTQEQELIKEGKLKEFR